MTPPTPQTLQGASAPIYHESWNCQTKLQSDLGHLSEYFETDWPSDSLTQMQLDYLWGRDADRRLLPGVRCEVLGVKCPPLWGNINNHQQLSGSTRKVSITDPGLSSVKGKCPKWDNLFPIRALPSCSNGQRLFFFADFCWDTRNFHALKWLLIILKIAQPR